MNVRRIVALLAPCTVCGVIGFLVGAIQPKPLYRYGLDWQVADAAQAGDLTKLEALRQRGADWNAIPIDYSGSVSGIPPVMVAALYNRPDTVAWLLDRGADVNVAMGPETALNIAEYNVDQAQRTLDVLKSHGAKHWDD